MAQQNGQNDQGFNKEIFVLIVVLLIGVTIWALWTYARPFVLYAIFSLDIIQFWVMDLFLDFGPKTLGFYELTKDVFRLDDLEFQNKYQISLSQVPFEWVMEISSKTGWGMKFITIPMLLLFTLYATFKMKGTGFSRTFTLTGNKVGPSLALYQSQHWRVITPGAKFNPDDSNNKEELPAKTPMEWMKDNEITLNEIEGLNYEAAAHAFEKQLGDRWNGVEKSKTYVKALCVIFYMNAKRDKNSRKIKENFAIIWSTKKTKEAEIITNKIFNDLKEKDKKFINIIDKYGNKHAYVNTALFRLLTWARDNGGVLASAEFRWLKPIDRTLWYVLNNCGRRAFHTEGAGAISHFFSENILRQPLAEPHIDQAVDGLENYLDNQGIIDLEEFFNEDKEL